MAGLKTRKLAFVKHSKSTHIDLGPKLSSFRIFMFPECLARGGREYEALEWCAARMTRKEFVLKSGFHCLMLIGIGKHEISPSLEFDSFFFVCSVLPLVGGPSMFCLGTKSHALIILSTKTATHSRGWKTAIS